MREWEGWREATGETEKQQTGGMNEWLSMEYGLWVYWNGTHVSNADFGSGMFSL